MVTSRPTVSLILPIWNGEQWVNELLSMLERQTRVPDEILVVDSGSTDASLALVKRHIAEYPFIRLLEIDQQDFDHGGTRTLAAAQTSGDILVCMTQDAVPATRDALSLLIQPFSNNEKIAATYGRQLPALGATFFAEHLRLFNYPEQSQIRCWQDRAAFGFKTIFISNSFAAWRRDLLAAQGFFPKRLLFGEDTVTLAKLMKNGYNIAYVSEAAVHHSHNYSIGQDVKRYFDIGVLHEEQQDLFMQLGGPAGAGRKYVRSELALLVNRKKYHLLPASFLRNLGKFTAYKLGRRHKLLPSSWAGHLSMNPGWWA